MEPALILAIMAAASMGANYAGQKKVDRAQARAMRDAAMRREELARKSDASAKSTTDILIGTPDKERDAAAARLAEVQAARDKPNPLTGQTTEQLVSSTLAPTASTQIVTDRATANAKSNKFLNQQAAARAKLAAFGDVMVGNNTGVRRNAQDIDQATQSMNNWDQFVLPAQMMRANQAGTGWKNLADAIQLASMIYAPIGLSAKPAEAATTAAFSWDAFGPQAAAAATPAVAAGAAPAYGTEAWNQATRNNVLNYYLRQGNVPYSP